MKAKSTFFALAFSALGTAATAQNFGFGGQQIQAQLDCSEVFTDINYAGDDNAYHTLDIYLPKEKKKKYPVVIHIYGSAWYANNMKGAADLGTIGQALLRAGYAVVCPNHRSSGDAKFPAQIQDIKAVVRFVRGEAKKYHLDPSFVATSGFSSGGHLASLAATTNGVAELEGSLGKYTKKSSNVNAACDWSGPIDLRNMDCAGVRNMPNTPEEALIGVPMQGNEDRYDAINPITYIDPKDPPIIIFHGTADNVVPPCQAPEFYDALRARGVKTDLNMVEGGGHGFNMYSAENLKRMTDFLDAARGK